MRVNNLHSWNVSPKDALCIQNKLRMKICSDQSTIKLADISHVAGCDVSYSKKTNILFAIVVVLTFPRLELVEEKHFISTSVFPYIPGLLAFREEFPLLKACKQLTLDPDVFLFDGHGVAHPRQMGIASHMGLFLEKPSIGIAKNNLWGNYKQPGQCKGSSSSLTKNGTEIGRVLRTRNKVKPVFVSVGHLIDTETAEEIALACCSCYRLPEPTRQAHLISNKLRSSN